MHDRVGVECGAGGRLTTTKAEATTGSLGPRLEDPHHIRHPFRWNTRPGQSSSRVRTNAASIGDAPGETQTRIDRGAKGDVGAAALAHHRSGGEVAYPPGGGVEAEGRKQTRTDAGAHADADTELWLFRSRAAPSQVARLPRLIVGTPARDRKACALPRAGVPRMG
ncbi:hypothetical protein IEO21_02027 [Rhodonia placenta]|uniref:Uncharacterized protein n=1 Tax=Rhodonia placenta TaxID=104341 RepID=A0A8H7P8G5_9APHY|nr:hypothetical protein IEO21_02027 [Postia placenta]